jgi:acyl carrier protein
MDIEVIRAKVKGSINRVTGIEAGTISDTASYDVDLGLDSLSILEIAVDVETQFKFQASDEELSAIHTVEDSVSLVNKRLSAEVG